MATAPIRAHGVPKKLGPARRQALVHVGGDEEDLHQFFYKPFLAWHLAKTAIGTEATLGSPLCAT